METQKPGVFTGKVGAVTYHEKIMIVIGLTHEINIPEIKETWGSVEEVKINTIIFKLQIFDTWAASVEAGISWSWRIYMTVSLLTKSNFARLYAI